MKSNKFVFFHLEIYAADSDEEAAKNATIAANAAKAAKKATNAMDVDDDEEEEESEEESEDEDEIEDENEIKDEDENEDVDEDEDEDENLEESEEEEEDADDEVDQFPVEKLLQTRLSGKKKKIVEYLVKWVGWDEPSWEPETNIHPGLIEKFKNEFN